MNLLTVTCALSTICACMPIEGKGRSEREELQALLELAKSKEITAKAIQSLDDVVGVGDSDIARIGDSIRARLDKASARSELAASRLEDQMDEVLERSAIDIQLDERKRRLGLSD